MLRRKNRQLKFKPQLIDNYGWFYNFRKKIEWMSVKKKMFYITNLLIILAISSFLLINNNILAKEYQPPVIELDGEVQVTPGVDSVGFVFETTAMATCRVSITDSSVSSQTDSHKVHHTFNFDNLDGNNSTELVQTYHYNIWCGVDVPDDNLLDNGSFETLSNEPTGDVEISDVVINPSTNTVTFDWQTNKSATSWVYIFNNDDAMWELVDESSNSYVKVHDILGSSYGGGSHHFEPNTTYHYYIMSSTDVNTHCAIGSKSEVCSATAESTFTTDYNLEITDGVTVEVGANQAVFRWHTNKPANSWVWITGLNGQGDNIMVTSHQVKITGLDTNATYHYYVSSGSSVGETCGDGTSSVNSASCAATSDATFTTVLGAGVDANVILRANRDRVCNEWMYCNAAVQVTNNKKNPPTSEDVCFGVGLCDQMDKGGKCAHIVDNNQSKAELTFKATKEDNEVNKIKNLSGYSKVGLDWGKRCSVTGLDCTNDANVCIGGDKDECVEAKISGYYPYYAMQELGLPVDIPNSNFDNKSIWPWRAERFPATEASVSDDSINGFDNHVLKIVPNQKWGGVETYNLAPVVDLNGLYIISFKARTDKNKAVEYAYDNNLSSGQRIVMQMILEKTDGTVAYYDFNYYNKKTNQQTWYVDLTQDPQEYVMFLDLSKLTDIKSTSPVGLVIADYQYTKCGNNSNNSNYQLCIDNLDYSDAYYVDDINMKTVLKITDKQNYIVRSCRMYPDKNATACNYYNQQDNKDMRGWQGYCIESDPATIGKARQMCLQWWPVDVISGESNIFSQNNMAGYHGVAPLYYCVQSEANYPYYKKNISNGYQKRITNNASEYCDIHTINLPYDVYKDEIIELKIEGIRFDNAGTEFENSGEEKCIGVAKSFNSYLNPSTGQKSSGGEGTLIFNDINKDYWDREFTDEFPRDNMSTPHAGYNKYASVECFGGKGDDMNFATARLIFDANNEKLTSIEVKYCDGEGGNDNDAGAYKYSDVNVTFKGERCNVIAQVVTPEGKNKAWTARIQKDGWLENNELGYSYSQDYIPYGAAVTAGLDNDPTKWTEPLYVMPANSATGAKQPYQIRAGSPYSISYPNGSPGPTCDINSGTNAGKTCLTNEDCMELIEAGVCKYDSSQDRYYCEQGRDGECDGTDADCDKWAYPDAKCVSPNYLSDNLVIGKTQCVAGSTNLGKECNNANDCGGGSTGYCAGIKLADKTIMALPGTINDGLDRLSNLFAEIYGVWQWNTTQKKYVPLEIGNYPGDRSHALGGVSPKITSIRINDSEDKTFEVVGQGTAVLKFDTWVNLNQLPLVSYSIDWDDGTSISESGLRMGNDANPHTLVHYYKYAGLACGDNYHPSSDGDYCEFHPVVIIKDNWGFTKVRTFEAGIKVYQTGTVLSDGKLDVEPNSLNFYSNNLPQTQGFKVSNINPVGNDLYWKIQSTDGIFATDPAIATLGYPYKVGYTGVLVKDSSEQIPVVIDNVGNLTSGTHTGVVTIISYDKDDASQTPIDTRTVTVYLEIP